MLQTGDKNSRIQLLYNPQDDKWLSRSMCLLRAQIETFEATPDDVKARSSRGGLKKPISVGQVGIRCARCSHLPFEKRANGAVSYPKSVKNVYQAVRNWQRYHFPHCGCIPESIKGEIITTRRIHSKKNSEDYWVKSCKHMGMVDADDGDGGILLAPSEGDNHTEPGKGEDARKEKRPRMGAHVCSQAPNGETHLQEGRSVNFASNQGDHSMHSSNKKVCLQDVLRDAVTLSLDWFDGKDDGMARSTWGTCSDPLPFSFELDGASSSLPLEGAADGVSLEHEPS